jgi:hypothetical protein
VTRDDKPDPIGPWAGDLDEITRRLHWRTLASFALIFAGPDSEFTRLACKAEFDKTAAMDAWRALIALPPLPRRRLLSSWNSITTMASGV